MNVFRTLSLAITCVALAAITIQSILRPTAQQPSYSAFLFPETIPLTSNGAPWQPITATESTASGNSHLNTLLFTEFSSADLLSTDLLSTNTFSGKIAAHQRYQYQKDNQHITIDARYLVNTNGNLQGLITALATETANPPAVTRQKSSEQGTYSLAAHKGHAYFNTCQNARGPATLTTDQFNQNRLIHDVRFSRVLPWIQGKNTLPDQRCLWTQIAVPLADYESEAEAYEAMEEVWRDWAAWWQRNFPPD